MQEGVFCSEYDTRQVYLPYSTAKYQQGGMLLKYGFRMATAAVTLVMLIASIWFWAIPLPTSMVWR